MLFATYGSCINKRQMAHICPTAKVICGGWVLDYKLTFRSIATLEAQEGERTPVLVWIIDMQALVALDRYAGAPFLYQKQILTAEADGKIMECIAYVPDGCEPALPNANYYETMMAGYKDAGIDESYLIGALEDTERRIQK